MTDLPRRGCTHLLTPQEEAIRDCVESIETMGADARLTDAINLLHAAREKVADYVDERVLYPNGAPRYAPDGMMLDQSGNRSVFDDVDA